MLYALLFLILRLPSLFEPYWYGDEGIYLTIGQGLRQGLLLYQQIHDNKPPTLYYFAALSQSVFGFRLLLLLFMIPTIYVFYLLAKKILVSKTLQKLATLVFLIITSIPLIEGNIANAEVFMLLPTLIAVYLFLFHQKSNFSFLISGLLLGFAFTIKVPVAIEFAFLSLWLLLFYKSKIKKLFLFSLAFVIPTLFYALYFYFQGALKPFLNAALFQNFGYLSSWATGTQNSSATSGGLVWRALILLLSWLIFFFAHRFRLISKNIFFLLSWFSATLFGALLSGRPYPHYLIQVLPPLCLLIFLFFKARLFIGFSFLVFVFALFHYHFYRYPVFSYYQNFYKYALHRQDLSSYRLYFGQDQNNIYALAQEIKSQSQPSDRFFMWGDQSFIFPLSDRLPSTKYFVAYHIVDFNAYSQIMSELKTHTPKFIVYYPQPSRPFPELDSLISNYYFLQDQIGQAYLYQLR